MSRNHEPYHTTTHHAVSCTQVIDAHCDAAPWQHRCVLRQSVSFRHTDIFNPTLALSLTITHLCHASDDTCHSEVPLTMFPATIKATSRQRARGAVSRLQPFLPRLTSPSIFRFLRSFAIFPVTGPLIDAPQPSEHNPKSKAGEASSPSELSDESGPMPSELDASSEDEDELDGVIDLDDDEHSEESKAARRALGPTNVYAPQGVRRWGDAKNLNAAVEYECECGGKCLRHIAADFSQAVITLYVYRQQMRRNAESQGAGGARDVMRQALGCHYDEDKKVFTRSFVIGINGRCCPSAFAVASGFSEGTFSRARSDVTCHRPLHAGRMRQRTAGESQSRAEMDTWVRARKVSMQRDKETGLFYHCAKDTDKNRWKMYSDERIANALPVHGSCSLLASVWKSHKEICSYHASGHDQCGQNLCQILP
jgi:hypothetical protein